MLDESQRAALLRAAAYFGPSPRAKIGRASAERVRERERLKKKRQRERERATWSSPAP